MRYRYAILVAVAVLALASLLPFAAAATPPVGDGGQDYVVQADDWLSKLADKFYGDPLAYPVIFEATNARAVQDSSYTTIANPDLITVGQKLYIPALDTVSAELVAAPDEPSLAPLEVVEPTGPTAEQQQLLNSLAVKGTPPELFNEVWLNSEPLKLANLRGQVVIVEFWTFG